MFGDLRWNPVFSSNWPRRNSFYHSGEYKEKFQEQLCFGHRADRDPRSVIVYILLLKVLIAANVLLVMENFEWILRKKTQQNIREPRKKGILWDVFHNVYKCVLFSLKQASSQSRDTNSGSFDSVMSYKLRYSVEGVTWTFYQQNGIDKVVLRYIYSNSSLQVQFSWRSRAKYIKGIINPFQIFLGNLVEHFTTKNHLALPVKARYVQFYPVSMINSACMRVELYGEKALEENTGRTELYLGE